MPSQQKLTVIVPVYNGEPFLDRCLDSIFNQSLKDIQVLLVDDGSNDGTINKVLKYVQKQPRLSLIQHPQNLGTGTARNTGLNLVKSPFVAFLDADDWIDSNAYLKMVQAIEETNADIALCGIRTEHNNSLSSTIRYHYPNGNLITSNFALKLLSKLEMQDIFISPMVGNKLFRTKFLKENNLAFPPSSLYEDDEFMFITLCIAKNLVLVPNVYQHYFQRESSAMHTFSIKYIDCLLCAFQNIRIFLLEKNLFKTYTSEYYAFLDRCLSSLLDTLFSNEQNVALQRKYITYLMEGLLKVFTMQELLSHIEPRRLQRIWL